MAEYRNRRLRKRAHGGAASGEGEGPPHGHHGVMLIIGIGPKKPKKKKGGHVEGKKPRHHLGKRARGGAMCRADGGLASDDLPSTSKDAGPGKSARPQATRSYIAPMQSFSAPPRQPMEKIRSVPYDTMGNNVAQQTKRGGTVRRRADGGRTQDAREASHNPETDTGDEVDVGMGTEERAERQGRARGGGAHAHRTPSGGIKASARHAAESRGHTMKGGAFPIEDARDLQNAKHDVGRAKNPEAARRWINKRAHELGEPPLGGE